MHCSTARFRFGETMAQTQLTWYGQSGFKIVTPSGKTLLIDPWLTNPVFEKGKDTLAALKDVDLILLSHGHSDHVGNTVEIGKKTGAKLVANFDLSGAVTSVLGYPSEQAESDTTGHIGGQLILLNGELTVCFVPAWHGSSVRKRIERTWREIRTTRNEGRRDDDSLNKEQYNRCVKERFEAIAIKTVEEESENGNFGRWNCIG